MIEKNIELSIEFSRYLFDHADLDESIPTDAEIVLLPEFDTELKEIDLRMDPLILLPKTILRLGLLHFPGISGLMRQTILFLRVFKLNMWRDLIMMQFRIPCGLSI